MSKTIYLADDEQNIRELIATYFHNDGFSVETFEDGESLLARFLDVPSDMVILDIMMPGTDGLTICTKIRQTSNVPIIIVSARDSEIDRITGITLGSDDYLTKPFSPMELVARAKAIFRRLSFEQSDNHLLSFGNLHINIRTRQASIQGTPIELTPTEFELMTYLIYNKDRAVSREELLKNIWKYDTEVDTRATDDVIKRLRKKLSNNHSTAVISSVWGFGFRIAESGDEFYEKY